MDRKINREKDVEELNKEESGMLFRKLLNGVNFILGQVINHDSIKNILWNKQQQKLEYLKRVSTIIYFKFALDIVMDLILMSIIMKRWEF